MVYKEGYTDLHTRLYISKVHHRKGNTKLLMYRNWFTNSFNDKSLYLYLWSIGPELPVILGIAVLRQSLGCSLQE